MEKNYEEIYVLGKMIREKEEVIKKLKGKGKKTTELELELILLKKKMQKLVEQ